MEERAASLSSMFPINTSGIWGSVHDLHSYVASLEQPRATGSRVVEAMFTPRATGSRPDQQLNPLSLPNFQDIIANTIKRGITAGLQHWAECASDVAPELSAEPTNNLPAERSLSPARSQRSQSPVSEEGEIRDADLSEDQGMALKQPAFSGLFQLSLFKSLLFKAKTSAKLEAKASSTTIHAQPTSAETLFSEQITEAETVPAPNLFVDVVQRQWASPTSGSMPSSADKRFYNVTNELDQFLQLPIVDAPAMALYTSANMLGAPEEALKPEDKRANLTLQQDHQAAAFNHSAGGDPRPSQGLLF